MQTFLPYPSFYQSAAVLDRQRLGKQRLEAVTLLGGGWSNHPASKMWADYRRALAMYGHAICMEWRCRGYKDNQLEVFERELALGHKLVLPPWLGSPEFHRSHRSNLLRKNPEHYRPLFEEGLSAELPYVWPEGKMLVQSISHQEAQ